MKKIGLILILSLLAICQTISAQDTMIKGVLADSLTHETEPFATIRVFKAKDMNKAVAMSVTDANGKIAQQMNGKGTFVITFSSVGKMTVNKTIILNGQQELNLDTVYTCDDRQTLHAVEVVAHKPLVKMETDKLSYQVADDVDSKSNTVLEMLRKVPMVTVDGQDNITVNGSSSFKVYVDGKPSVMMSSNPSQVFKNMPASAVKSIEVVTNPGAKYDAEGVGGVLNIVMNKTQGTPASMNGYNGTVRGLASTKGFGGSAYLSGQQGKFSYSANGMYNYGRVGDTEITIDREQMSSAGNSLMHYEQSGTTKFPFSMGNLNMSYELDSLSTLSATLGMTNFTTKSSGHPTTQMSGGIYGNGFSYANQMRTNQSKTSFNGSIDYQHFFDAQHQRSLIVTYMLSVNPAKTDNYSEFDDASATTSIDLTDRYSHNKENALEHTVQADYTSPVSKTTTLSLGTKFVARNNKSDATYYLKENGEYVLNAAGSVDYRHTNDILAGYAEVDTKVGKFGFKEGLRYEQTWQKVTYKTGNGDNFTKNYGNLVPSASLSYNISQMQNIGLTYNMRITRPGISYLNPYVDRSNPTGISYGNTNLNAEKAHNIALVYNLFNSKFMMNVNLHQSLCNNAIEEYSFNDANNMLNTTYGNIVKRSQTGLNVYANWSAVKNTRLIFNGGLTYTDLRSDMLDMRNNGWQGNAMLGVQQTLPMDIRLSANLITSSKSYTLQGWTSGFNMVVGSVSKSFLKDKLNISIAALTGLSQGGSLMMNTYSHGSDFINHQKIKIPVSNLMLNVSFSFGNTKMKSKTQSVRKVENEFIEQRSQSEILNGATMQ
jgi:outer membrane receptor protein involved in Fe transport